MANKVTSQKTEFLFKPIGFVESPFNDKFGIPRQPGLVSDVVGKIKFISNPDIKTALKTIESFSHIWIIFVFHDHGGLNWKPSIRPPRLGGNKKVGVLASRSPHRPNPIGISAVKIGKLNIEALDGPELEVFGIDLLNGTPVLDIKPYLVYADSHPQASAGWAQEAIVKTPVHFTKLANQKILAIDPNSKKNFKNLITQVIEIDPRPAHQKRKNPITDSNSNGLKYGIDILGHDVKYTIEQNHFVVLDII